MEGEDRPGRGERRGWGTPRGRVTAPASVGHGRHPSRSVGDEGRGAAGTAAVGTPGPGDPARFERAEIETPRCLPAASPGRGEPGVARVGRGHVVPESVGLPGTSPGG